MKTKTFTMARLERELPALYNGCGDATAGVPGDRNMQARWQAVRDLRGLLERELGRPVTDAAEVAFGFRLERALGGRYPASHTGLRITAAELEAWLELERR